MTGIKDLLDKEKALSESLSKVRKAISAFQEVCEHDWKDDGHDSHKRYIKCKICDKRDWD